MRRMIRKCGVGKIIQLNSSAAEPLKPHRCCPSPHRDSRGASWLARSLAACNVNVNVTSERQRTIPTVCRKRRLQRVFGHSVNIHKPSPLICQEISCGEKTASILCAYRDGTLCHGCLVSAWLPSVKRSFACRRCKKQQHSNVQP